MNETVNPEPNAPAEPEAAASSQQDEPLDSLLSEWDESPEPQRVEAPTQSPAQQDPMVLEMYQEMVSRDLDKAVDRIYDSMGDMPSKPNRSMVRDWMEGRAQRDARLHKAFTQRRNNPTGWDKVVDGLSGEFTGQFSAEKIASDTDDRVSATAYVQGSSTKDVPKAEVSNDDLAKMSDEDFNEYQRKLGI